MLKKSPKAFSLLESLIALLVISLSLGLFQGLTLMLKNNLDNRWTNQEEWILFCQQFREELSHCRLDIVSTDGLYVFEDKKELLFSLTSKGDFRKSNRDGRGYQPLLFNLKEVSFHQESESIIWITFTFQDGLERRFFYAFEEKS